MELVGGTDDKVKGSVTIKIGHGNIGGLRRIQELFAGTLAKFVARLVVRVIGDPAGHSLGQYEVASALSAQIAGYKAVSDVSCGDRIGIRSPELTGFGILGEENER